VIQEQHIRKEGCIEIFFHMGILLTIPSADTDADDDTLIFMTHADCGGCSSTDLLPILLVSTTAYTNFKLGASSRKKKVDNIQGGFQERRKRKL
jgi:hypothetical protein